MSTDPTNRPGTPAWQPPLSYSDHAWRILVCGVVGLLAYASVLSTTLALSPRPDHLTAVALLDLFVLGPIALALLAWHRRHPLPVALAIIAIGAVSSVATLAAILGVVSITARRVERELVAVGAAYLAATALNPWLRWTGEPTPLPQTVGGLLVGLAIPMGVGWYLGVRRQREVRARRLGEAVQRELAERAEQARTQERVRIAREMHDVLAHRISLVSMHAGALAFRDDLPADTVRAEAGIIQHTAHEALTELRGVLGSLRSPDGGPAEPPQPLFTDLDTLIAEARTAGSVELNRELGDLDPPAWLGRQVYRIVQECLTNARKHAPGAAVRVDLAGRPGAGADDGLRISVTNLAPTRVPDTAPGAGLGLVGLAERAALSGGTLDHGPTADGGWAVRVRLPWTRENHGD